jgi:hypothetical protein
LRGGSIAEHTAEDVLEEPLKDRRSRIQVDLGVPGVEHKPKPGKPVVEVGREQPVQPVFKSAREKEALAALGRGHEGSVQIE